MRQTRALSQKPAKPEIPLGLKLCAGMVYPTAFIADFRAVAGLHHDAGLVKIVLSRLHCAASHVIRSTCNLKLSLLQHVDGGVFCRGSCN